MTKSKQPKKQRFDRYNAPFHKRIKYLKATLSPELRKRYNRRTAIIQKDDTVRVMCGDLKGHEGKVQKTYVKKEAVAVDGVVVAKSDDTEVERPIHPSNLMITKLNLQDNHREQILNR